MWRVMLMGLVLGGCEGRFSIPPQQDAAQPPTLQAVEGPQAPIIVERSTGETPSICYVRARNFKGLVPLSCDEAQLVRP